MSLTIRRLLLATLAAVSFGSVGWTQAPASGELSPANQDADMRPTTQTMQTVGEHTDRPGVAPQRQVKPTGAPKKPPAPDQSATPSVPDPESKTSNGAPPPSAGKASPHLG